MKPQNRIKIRAALEKSKNEFSAQLQGLGYFNDAENGDEIDKSVTVSNRFLDQTMRVRLVKSIEQVDHALNRLDTSVFGVCLECEETIPLARLLVAPTTIFCTLCQQDYEQKRCQ